MTHRLCVANAGAPADARRPGAASSVGVDAGHELVADRLARAALRTSGLTIFHARLRAGSTIALRRGSRVEQRRVGAERVAPRVVGAGGVGSTSTSYTSLSAPSTSRSRRAQNRCWWMRRGEARRDQRARTSGVVPARPPRST